MRPAISTVKLSDTLTLSQCHRHDDKPAGFWLYDKTRGMNLALAEPTEIAALTEALTYYQKRLKRVSGEYKALYDKVSAFIVEVRGDDEDFSDPDFGN